VLTKVSQLMFKFGTTGLHPAIDVCTTAFRGLGFVLLLAPDVTIKDAGIALVHKMHLQAKTGACSPYILVGVWLLLPDMSYDTQRRELSESRPATVFARASTFFRAPFNESTAVLWLWNATVGLVYSVVDMESTGKSFKAAFDIITDVGPNEVSLHKTPPTVA